MVSRYVSNFALGIGPGNPNGHPPTHVAPMPLGVAMAATAAAAAAAAAVPLSTVTQTQPTQPPSSSQQQQSQLGGGGVGGQPTQQPPHASQSLKGPLQPPPPPQNPQTPAEYHVQQCLMSAGTHGANTSQPPPPPHQHYRILHSRSDGYVAAPSPGFSAPQSGPPHQGPPVIRGMQSAPPSASQQQQELSKMQQQPIYVPPGGGTTPGTVRPNQQGSMYRSASTSAPRAPRHVAMQPQLFQQQMVMQPHYYPRQPASQIFSPQYFSPPQMAPNFAYGGPYYVPANYVPQHRSNAVSGGIVPPAGATLVGGSGASQAQILSTNVLTAAGTAAGQPGTGQATGTNNLRKKRKFALEIIDPYTHKNVLDDLEMSKNQNSTAQEVDYTEQMNLQANNDVLGPPPQVIDSTINSDPNFNSKTSQGMVFVDMMQQRKISAIPASCQNQVNEMIAPTTPVVSAMSDAPSVDIHHKSQTKKKNRILETIPQQSTQIVEGTDKISSDNSKISLTDSSGGSNLGGSSHISNVNDGISDKCSQQQQQQQITTTVTSSNLPSLVSRTSEDVSMNKAINRIDTENSSVSTSSVYHSSNVVGSSTSSSNIDSRDQILINSSGGGGGGGVGSSSSSSVVGGGGGGVNSNKTGVLTNSNNISTNNSSSGVISSNHHQQQQQQNSSTQHSQQAVQSVTSSNQQQHSQTEHKQQQPLPKRDIKSFQHNKPVSQQHQQQQQHSQQSSLPLSANNNNSPSTISNFIVNNTSNSNISQTSSNNKSFSPSLSSSSTTTSSSPYPSNNSSQTTSTNLQSMPVVVPTPSAPSTGTSGQQSSAATLPTKGVSVSAVDSNSVSNSNSGGSNTAAMPSSATTKSSHKGKDKIQQQHYHSQQQQHHQATTTNINNNNLAGIDTSSSVVTNSKNLQEKQNSVNNNLQQSSVTMANIVDNKMKLNEKDELCGANSKQKMLSSDHHSVFHSNQGSPQALDETDRVGSINEKSSELVDEISNYCNNNDKPYNKVTDNTTNNKVTSKSKSIPPNDKETSNSRMQQQKSTVVSKDSNKMNSSNSGSSSSNNNISKGETANNKSTIDADTVAYKEKSSNDSCKRDSNNSTNAASGDTLSSDTTATITNGTATPVSGPLSPPPSNNSITNDTEKILPPAHVSLIQYNDGQWSPSNPEGAKVYDRSQLLNLRNSPASKAKPDLKNEVASIVLQGNRSAQLQPSLMPPFARGGMGNKGVRSIGGTGNMSLGGGGMSGSQSGNMYMKQSSMSGVNMKNNSKGSKSGVIHLSLSLREDVKLNESENAWRPTHLKQNDNLPPEERSKDEVIRRVRGILNKLTPEKFETLVEQIMVLQIDTKEKVISVMELVFEKAIDEPNFSASYAKLCSRIADNKLQSDVKCKDEKTIAQQKASNLTAFKSALIDKTQHEFVGNVSNCDAKNTKLKPLMETIATCTDPEKKLELEAILEEEERKIRRRSGGTVRFIGELFKINMLTIKIIRDCINNLLDPSSEDKLECLCKLLTTVGKKIESSPEKDGINTNLENIFAKMKNIVDRKIETKISSRVRFMLQDVIDLRKNKWNSTKTDANPKTMEQIQKEIKTEQMSSQYGNFNLMSNKKDDRRYGGASSGGGLMSFGGGSGGGSGGGGGGGGGYYKSNRQQQSGEETWYTQPSKGNRAVDTSKLGQMFNTDIDNGTKLGGMSKFQWNQTSGTLGSTTTTSNQFAALSSLDSNKNISVGPRNKGSYNKGSMERDRYGSTHGSRESSSSRNASRGGANDKDRDQDRDTGRGSMQRNVPSSHHSYGSSSSSATVPSKSNKSVTMPQSLSGSTITSATSRYDIPTEQASSQQDIFEKPDSKMSENIEKNAKKMITVAYEETFDEALPYLLSYPEKYRWYYIYVLFYDYLHSTKVGPVHRKVASDFVSFLFHQNLITLKQFVYAYEEFCEMADDIIIDVPGLFQYIFQFVGPFIYKGDLTIRNFWNNKFQKDLRQKFLQEMILYFVSEVGPNNTRKLWRNSDFKWTDFLPEQDVAKFIKDNKFEFIDSENCKPPITGTTDLQRIRDRLKELLNETTKVDDIFDYLEGNIVNIENIDKQFIRALTETLCEYAINEKTNKLDTKKFQKICLPILQRYLNLKEDRELECLYAIQYLINKLEHPSGLLNEIFAELYEAETVAADTFMKWRESKEEPAGKGVAVKGLNSFFLNLSEEDACEENN